MGAVGRRTYSEQKKKKTRTSIMMGKKKNERYNAFPLGNRVIPPGPLIVRYAQSVINLLE